MGTPPPGPSARAREKVTDKLSAMDHLSPAERSRNMSLMKSKNTAPEIKVRKLIFSMGFRYRLHAVALPGKPDIVFKGRRKAIFVHGCFWHRHQGCRRASMPNAPWGRFSAPHTDSPSPPLSGIVAFMPVITGRPIGWRTSAARASLQKFHRFDLVIQRISCENR